MDVDICDQCDNATNLTSDTVNVIINCLRRRGRLAVVRGYLVTGPAIANTTLYKMRHGVPSMVERR